MSEPVTIVEPAHEPDSVKNAHYWFRKLKENLFPIVVASFGVGGTVYMVEEARYKDILEGLHTQIGTQAATIQGQAAAIKNQDATIAQLREQLKGTSPELAAIQANRDRIRATLQEFYVQGGKLFRRKVSNEPSFNTWMSDADSWVIETKKWIVENMGQAAVEKFVDRGDTATLFFDDSFNKAHTDARNAIIIFRRNLSTLIETAAWDGRPERVK